MSEKERTKKIDFRVTKEEKELIDFIVGSKWVAKCSITARTMGTSYITAYEGEVLELTSIWDTQYLEFNHQYVLEKGEARLLLSPLERLG